MAPGRRFWLGCCSENSRDGHFRITRAVVGTYLIVAILHRLWDGLPSVVGTFTGSGLDVFISQSLIGLVGLFLLWRRWREAVRLQLSQNILPSPENPQSSEPLMQ